MPLRQFIKFAPLLLLLALLVPATAAAKDRNHDHISDKWEKHFNLSLKVNQAKKDQDHDGLNNRGEFISNNNPRKADTNADGVVDGDENAAVVSSYDADTGQLVINLLNGGNVTGTVDDNTQIICASGQPPAVTTDHGISGDHGDDNGPPPPPEGQGPPPPPGDDGHGQGPPPPQGQPGHGSNDNPGDTGDNGDAGTGDNPGDTGDDNGEHHQPVLCTTDALVPGAVVHEAQLGIEDGNLVFEHIVICKGNQLAGDGSGDRTGRLIIIERRGL